MSNNLLIRVVTYFIVVTWGSYGQPAIGKEKYKRAVEQADNVKNKLFPKKETVEIGAPNFGLILNQSYVNSYVIQGNVSYYFAEDWGFSIEALIALNEDKPERYCIENFYNDFEEQVGASCPSPDEDKSIHLFDENGNPKRGANFGPAYVAIREINYILTGAASWAPIYGKQLAFLSNTIYFDLYFTFGGGVTLSTYYPKTNQLRNGNRARGAVIGDLPEGGCPSGDGVPGICPDNPDVDKLIGVDGRPDAEEEISPTLTVGIGQRFHFWERWHFKAEVRNYTLLATNSGFEPFFTLWVGFGVRI